jgi:CrcB protein
MVAKRIHKEKTLTLKNILVVAVGGIIGSLSRWAVSLAIVDRGFPWATLLVNYTGSVILMTLLLYIRKHKAPKWWWRPALGAGFCGGFTTYSAFSLKIEQYFNDGKVSTALIYAMASLVGTYILVFATNEFFKTRWAK